MAELSNGVNKKIAIRAVLGVLIFTASFLSWSSLTSALADGPDWLQKSLWSLAAFLFLGVFSGLAYLIESKMILYYGLPPLIILPALLFLKNDLISGLVMAVALVFLALAAWQAEFEKSLRIEFTVGVILKKSLAPFVTALALIVTVFFYFAPFTQSLEKMVAIPRPLFDVIARPAMDIALPLVLPPGQSIKNLPPEFYRQQAELLEKLYISINDELAAAGQSFKKWLPLGVSISLFFSFKIIGIFLSWLMLVVAWLVFRLLLLVGIVKIEKVAAEKEVIIT